ncbi:Dimodular nonribosomal peptide synthase [Phytophthora cinnamomi]|uniref:Dimodular nonribosomal peptide synthase n=1 Tax=Phytophthora cinnamomi TaxID=4785 RepID=UPI00355A8510|nr:Dimodular nonribosomal peptide synthase [Phytophthora cinnamomi]
MEAAVDDDQSSARQQDTSAAVAGDRQQKKRRKHYSIKVKREVLRATQGLSQCDASRQQGVPRWTLVDWRRAQESIASYSGSEKRLSRVPDRPEIVPFATELATYMKDTRREGGVLTSKVMATFVHDQHPRWLASYIEGKKDTVTAHDSLLRLLRRFAYQPGFVQRTPSGLKEKLEDLVAVRDEFAKTLSEKYGSFDAVHIYNADETGIYFDTPPSKMLSGRGKPASITAEQKHSARLTAVCTIRADGLKLP